MESKNAKNISISDMYSKYSVDQVSDFLSKTNSTEDGLSPSESEDRFKKYGPNEIDTENKKKWYNYLLDSLISPFNLILLGINVVLLYTDVILPEKPSYANITVIFILVIVSTLLEFFQEYNSNKAAEKLKELVETTCTVIRGGEEKEIPINEVVPGDLVVLSAGSMIPADLRLIVSKDLYVSQSSLTGESEAVKKSVELEDKNSLEDISSYQNICFMGTNVISGSAKGIVIHTGQWTYFGQIADTITTSKPKTSFETGVESISKLLIRFMLVLIPIVFLINVGKHELVTAFTFAVAIAIGITPLLLPVILSSSLSHGAIKMSKKKSIVKNSEAIQNFGSMNILCTDKTGTLTEDKIVLEKYLDVTGNENPKILELGFLNSYFQTGLKGSIDQAIISRGIQNGLDKTTEIYSKIDEIPFDFSRRRLSVIVSKDNCKLLITKGAVEEILDVCSLYEKDNKVDSLSASMKEEMKHIATKLNEDGLRVVALCKKENVNNINSFSVSDENNMILLGFIGFLDPPKATAKESITRLNNAGIRVIVLTGDNKEVTKNICDKVGINSEHILLGSNVDKLSDRALLHHLTNTNIFAKLSPIQKARIVRLLKENGNTVGYMGDGINDSPSLVNSDVGISVDTAVDISKESADIILLEKDLNVLLDGVSEGRKTFCNIMKYIKMAASFNFGEVFSVIVASILLPFFPITPIQLLVQSLLYDFGQMTLPFDNVDKEYLEKPKKWDIKGLKNFMIFMGPLSSCFDMIVFGSLWFIFNIREAAIFQTVWFSYGIVSNLVGLHIIRTALVPFKESHASKLVYLSSILLSIIAMVFPFTFLGKYIGLVDLSLKYYSIIILVPLLYCFVALYAKKIYQKKYGEWI